MPDKIDTTTAHPARRYDYWLGGKDHFAVDRASGDAIAEAFPAIRTWAIENRGFMRRAAAYLAREAGIRQFLDIGTGIPTSPNLHEVVQEIAPESRVAYIDNDPLVLVHARALMSSATPRGAVAYLEADLHDPDAILGSDEVKDVLDLSRPVALSLVAVLHFFHDNEVDDPYRIVRTLVDALPSGSYLAISHASWDYLPPAVAERLQHAQRGEVQPRSKAEFEQFFTGLELVEPGISLVSEWRDDRSEQPDPSDVSCYGAVARIP
ncbi:SAM-dependent methyltransferase [Cryptosporangium minutisporangium]|uniref:SAM-dependent methyltransferase n=1 Tax=Cryptosporangium minutisporangium TaxID=113569 RepID=A0ABP6ST28_9ACTN